MLEVFFLFLALAANALNRAELLVHCGRGLQNEHFCEII